MATLTRTKLNEFVNSFVVHYFNTFDTNRKALKDLFRDDSLLICQDITYSAPLIVSALEALPSEHLTHSISSIDWKHQLPEACLVFVCGKQHHPARPPLHFSQVFHLHIDDDNSKFYVYRAIYKVHSHGVGGPIP